MELNMSTSFAEQYMLSLSDYTDIPVASLPLSVRVLNRFRTNKIDTIADLLQKTPSDLLSFHGFGRGCLEEIDEQLSSLQNNSLYIIPQKGIHSKSLTRQYRDKIIQGDFTFSSTEISKNEMATLQKYKEAYNVLGKELVNECVTNTSKIQRIIDMLQQFNVQTNRAEEIAALAKVIPAYRLQNLARGYIYAFTQSEEARDALVAMYKTENACLGDIIGIDINDASFFPLVKKFLKWCTFDLTSDVTILLNNVISNNRLETIIRMRAQKCTLEKCGNKLGLTRERIRQLEAKTLRIFARLQSQIKLIAKISAEKNGDIAITPADIERYAGDSSLELLYLLRNHKGGAYTYDEQLDVFIIGDDSLHGRIFSFVDALPNMFPVAKVPEYLERAKDDDLPASMVEIAIKEAYKLTGEIYHRSRLSLASIYTTILKEYYPNGIKAYDPDEIYRFRLLVKNHYGNVKLPENNRALTARISGICVLCGKGMYKLRQKSYIPQQLAERIYDYIVTSNESIFLMNTLFSVFEEDLRQAGVDNKYYLQGILRELYGDDLVFTRDYVSKDGGETSIYSSVVEYIKQSRYPVSKKQIQEKFPGISDIVISFSIGNANILNFFGEYLHTSRLSITLEEEIYLEKTLQTICADNLAHHIKEFYEVIIAERPEILRRNAVLYPFSAYSVLEYLFRDKFQFSRPYISLPGIEFGRPAERLHELLYSSEEFTFDDISDFSKDNHYWIQSQLDYVNSCNDKYLIINDSTVKSIESIGINEEIAHTVEQVILNEVIETVPISQLSCWDMLPPINVPWTEWLIYSVLNKWSRQLSVAPSSNQFRLSIPLVAPNGKMDTLPFADVYKNVKANDSKHTVVADNLEDIDSILAEMLGDELLEDDLWD